MQYELPDFDTLARMAKEDPEGLEKLRVKLSLRLKNCMPNISSRSI